MIPHFFMPVLACSCADAEVADINGGFYLRHKEKIRALSPSIS